jgi:large subunit ribosomal protein L21
MSYAIISLGGKQHRVQEGERLIVDRLPTEAGKTFHPQILLAGGDGEPVLAPTDVQVTARVVKHDLGPKVRIGKYKPKKGYRRHNGHRSRITQIEIESIGRKAARKSSKAAEKAEAAEETTD